METTKIKSIKGGDIGLDYALITLIIAYVLGTIVQALFKLGTSIF